MNVDAIILSEAAVLTDDSTSLSVLKTVNTMKSPGFPATLPSLYLSLMIHAHPSEHGTTHEVSIRLLNERRKLVSDILKDRPFTLAGGEGMPKGIPIRHYLVHGMINTQFGSPGAYAFEVFIDGTYAAGTAFYIAQAEPDGQG